MIGHKRTDRRLERADWFFRTVSDAHPQRVLGNRVLRSSTLRIRVVFVPLENPRKLFPDLETPRSATFIGADRSVRGQRERKLGFTEMSWDAGKKEGSVPAFGAMTSQVVGCTPFRSETGGAILAHVRAGGRSLVPSFGLGTALVAVVHECQSKDGRSERTTSNKGKRSLRRSWGQNGGHSW